MSRVPHIETARWPMIIAALIAGVALVPEASARKCIGHAYETFSLRFVQLYYKRRAVAPVGRVEQYDQALNSSSRGRSLLLWNAKRMSPAKFFIFAKATTPTPSVAKQLARDRARTLKTACDNVIPYTPIEPGRYVFEQEHSSGNRTSSEIRVPAVIVDAQRKTLTLTFEHGHRSYQAVYDIVCAYYSWDSKRQPGGKTLPKCAKP